MDDCTSQHRQPQIDFCTLGMFIIDEVEFQPPTPPVKNIMGGAGSYAALGARIFSPPPLSRSVGWIVDCGSDFPLELREMIGRWDTSCMLRETPERLTTRGWNGYGEGDHRSFTYTTPKLRLDHYSLSLDFLHAGCFHLICSPTRCVTLTEGIVERRKMECPSLSRPVFVWEPWPDACNPDELTMARRAMQLIDVVSPNHEELAAFFKSEHLSEPESSSVVNGEMDLDKIEYYSDRFLGDVTNTRQKGSASMIVRCSKLGCYIRAAESAQWLPAYHEAGQSRVVDPTGGGNAFLGGVGTALARGRRLKEAAEWGSVAASFAIEQVGMPTLTKGADGEKWNGVSVEDRLAHFQAKIAHLKERSSELR